MKRFTILYLLACVFLALVFFFACENGYAQGVMRGHGAPDVNTPSSADNRFYIDVETGRLYIATKGSPTKWVDADSPEFSKVKADNVEVGTTFLPLAGCKMTASKGTTVDDHYHFWLECTDSGDNTAFALNDLGEAWFMPGATGKQRYAVWSMPATPRTSGAHIYGGTTDTFPGGAWKWELATTDGWEFLINDAAAVGGQVTAARLWNRLDIPRWQFNGTVKITGDVQTVPGTLEVNRNVAAGTNGAGLILSKGGDTDRNFLRWKQGTGNWQAGFRTSDTWVLEYQSSATPNDDTGWTQAMVVTSAGKLTLGANLDVKGVINATNAGGTNQIAGTNPILRINATGGGVVVDIAADATTGSVGTNNNGPLLLKAQNVERARFATDGGMKLAGIAQPACDATHAGTFWYSGHSAGVKDSVAVCAADASNAYAWRTIY